MASVGLKNKKLTRAKDGSNAPALKMNMLVADQFRVEAGGKLLAIGLYPDGIVVVQLPEDMPGPTPEVPVLLGELMLLITISGAPGTYEAAINIGEAHSKEMHIELSDMGPANLLFGFRPLAVQSFGQKTVTIDMAGQRHELKFEVRRGALLPEAPSPLTAKPSAPQKPRTRRTRANSPGRSGG